MKKLNNILLGAMACALLFHCEAASTDGDSPQSPESSFAATSEQSATGEQSAEAAERAPLAGEERLEKECTKNQYNLPTKVIPMNGFFDAFQKGNDIATCSPNVLTTLPAEASMLDRYSKPILVEKQLVDRDGRTWKVDCTGGIMVGATVADGGDKNKGRCYFPPKSDKLPQDIPHIIPVMRDGDNLRCPENYYVTSFTTWFNEEGGDDKTHIIDVQCVYAQVAVF
jgi:hypothetical protein